VAEVWPRRTYRIQAVFCAPLPFVFAWCTDISSIDPKLRRRKFIRKIIDKNPARVVYEDLEESASGWGWDRNVMTRNPPNRWRLDAVGNHFDTVADYLLSPASDGRTRLKLAFRLRPKTAVDRLPAKRSCEREVRAMWRLYAVALERAYRQRPGRSVRGRRASSRSGC
jgi:hypothetical protein